MVSALKDIQSYGGYTCTYMHMCTYNMYMLASEVDYALKLGITVKQKQLQRLYNVNGHVLVRFYL